MYFSSAWNFPSGSRSVTRWLPRTLASAREQLLVREPPCCSKSACTSRSCFATASRKCSTETKSSLSFFASSSARRRTSSVRRDRPGSAPPLTRGSPSSLRGHGVARGRHVAARLLQRAERRRRPLARASRASRCSGLELGIPAAGRAVAASERLRGSSSSSGPVAWTSPLGSLPRDPTPAPSAGFRASPPGLYDPEN